MKRTGQPRRNLLIEMCPSGLWPIVDVGADHGHVAAAVGAFANERMPNRMGRSDVAWVICDGLSAFSHVGVAIIAGMGARTIIGILERGPRPQALLAHAQDDPPMLRKYLAANGWRFDREGLAPEAGRFAEVMLLSNGYTEETGLALEYGPRLAESESPYLREHFEQQISRLDGIATNTKRSHAAVYEDCVSRINHLKKVILSATNARSSEG
jgi:tRNA A22 N-methylase